MRKPKRLLIAGPLAGGALLAAACGQVGAPTKHHSATPKVSCHAITAKAHIEGTGQYLLTLQGVVKPVSVPKPAFKAADVGGRYCADK
jgi:hypothetical protein